MDLFSIRKFGPCSSYSNKQQHVTTTTRGLSF
jgi:hypothetical protein